MGYAMRDDMVYDMGDKSSYKMRDWLRDNMEDNMRHEMRGAMGCELGDELRAPIWRLELAVGSLALGRSGTEAAKTPKTWASMILFNLSFLNP